MYSPDGKTKRFTGAKEKGDGKRVPPSEKKHSFIYTDLPHTDVMVTRKRSGNRLKERGKNVAHETYFHKRREKGKEEQTLSQTLRGAKGKFWRTI